MRRPTLSHIIVFVLLVSMAISAVSAATLYTKVVGPGFDSGWLATTSVTCSDYNVQRTPYANFGSYEDCNAQCPGGDGTYTWRYGITSISCSGPSSNTLVDGGTERSGNTVSFCPRSGSGSCSVSTVNYCDCTNPSGASISDSSSWYRNDFSTSASFNDNYNAYEIDIRQRTSGGSWTSYYDTFSCGSGTSCNEQIAIQIPYSGTCDATGANRCEVEGRFRDYWNRETYDTERFNIDRIIPSSSGSILGSPDYSDGSIDWYRDEATVEVDSADTVSTSDQSGIDAIHIDHRSDSSGCASPGSSAYTSYDRNSLSASASQTFSTSGNERARFCYYADDNALSSPGNEESPQTTASNVWVDGADPTTTVEEINVWTRGDDLELDITCEDIDGSWCDEIWYDPSNIGTSGTSCSPNQMWDVHAETVTRTYTEPGYDYCPEGSNCEFAFCAYSIDNVGNQGPTDTETYHVDRKDPTVDEFSYDPTPRSGTSDRLSGAVDSWFNDDFEVSVTFRDDGSGVDSCRYRINGGAWRDLGCGPGNPTVGADGDRVESASFTVSVGSGAECSTQGRETCVIEVEATDAVGNVMAATGERVSIDWTAPTCQLAWVYEGDGAINQHYNDTEKIHYYNNDDPYNPQNGDYTVEVYFTDEGSLTAGDVSGIQRTWFPTLTDEESGGPFSESLIMRDDRTDYPDYTRQRTYDYDSGDTYSTLSGPDAEVEVQDEAGNVGSCTFGLVRDLQEPLPTDNEVDYDHVNVEHPDDPSYDPNLYVNLGADDPDGSGVRNVEVRLTSTIGTTDSGTIPSDYLPYCGSFDYSSFNPALDPLISTSPDGYSGPLTMNATERSTFESTLLGGRGECFQAYGVFYDNVNNFVVVEPQQPDKVMAVDASPSTGAGDYRNACGFFGTFDNCNDRSEHLNGRRTDQYLTMACEGSCRRGTVYITEGGSTDEYDEDSEVNVLGFDKPNYRTESDPDYRIFNISDPYSGNGRDYTLEAKPTDADSRFFASQTKIDFVAREPLDPNGGVYPEVKDVDFIIGFRPSQCTSSCTLSSDPAPGTCRIDCAGFNGCVSDEQGEVNEASDEYEALEVCNGLSSGFVTTENGKVYNCCTLPVGDESELKTRSTDFEVDAEEISRSERLVYLNGKLVKLVVVAFDQSE